MSKIFWDTARKYKNNVILYTIYLCVTRLPLYFIFHTK